MGISLVFRFPSTFRALGKEPSNLLGLTLGFLDVKSRVRVWGAKVWVCGFVVPYLVAKSERVENIRTHERTQGKARSRTVLLPLLYLLAETMQPYKEGDGVPL